MFAKLAAFTIVLVALTYLTLMPALAVLKLMAKLGSHFAR